jgi:hypothetical protein
VRGLGAGGVSWSGRGQGAGFAVPVANAAGNNLPGITGALDRPFGPGPGPASGGQLGGTGDGQAGADPRAPHMSPDPVVFIPGPGPEQLDTGAAGGRQSWWRGGLQGFSDKLTVKDRHVYWDTGNQKTGLQGKPGGSPNAYNNPLTESPRPDLRALNRTVSYQKGSDATRNQDDLTRKYTWLGEQGSGWTPVYGGVPGLYVPYGSRGGVPYPVVAPVEQGQPGDGPHLVWSGPPHGLHSETPWKGGAQIIARFAQTPQTRPVRQDRPSNSPQAGQSYSQTVLPQGASPVRPSGGRFAAPVPGPGVGGIGGRGWAGRAAAPPRGAGSWLGG